MVQPKETSAEAENLPSQITAADAMLAQSRSALAADLKRIAADPDRRVFAVFDGALFDDIDAELTAAGLSHRSLYINVADQSLVDAGPWLVDFYGTLSEDDASVEEQAELPGEQEPDADALTDEALSAQANALAATMKAALDAGDETGGGMITHETVAFNMPALDMLATRIDAAVTLLGTYPNAAIFWIGDKTLTEERLWKHTRSINRVMIPREFADEDWEPPAEAASADTQDGSDPERSMPDGAPPNNASDPTHTDVMFRHADGNVLAEVLPVLDEAQFQRLFGPADALTCLSPEQLSAASGSALRRAVRPEGKRASSAGLLALNAAQLAAIRQTRLDRSRRRITAYLRKVAPEITSRISDTELSSKTSEWMNEALGHGVRSESALGRWCYLQLITTGEMGKQKDVLDFLTGRNPGHNPDATTDDRVRTLMQMAAERAGDVVI